MFALVLTIIKFFLWKMTRTQQLVQVCYGASYSYRQGEPRRGKPLQLTDRGNRKSRCWCTSSRYSRRDTFRPGQVRKCNQPAYLAR